jgi:hypothetical protein
MRQFHGTLTARFPISPFVTSKSHPWASNKLLIACKKDIISSTQFIAVSHLEEIFYFSFVYTFVLVYIE